MSMKKKMLITALLVLVLMLACTSALALTLYVSTPNGRTVNLRDANSNILARVPNGAAVTVTNTSTYTLAEGYPCYFCSYGSYRGYIQCRYLTTGSAVPTVSPSSNPTAASVYNAAFTGFSQTYYYVTVNPSRPTGFVNLRWAPSTDAPVIGIYYMGSSLRVIQQNSTWAQVYDESKGVCGFMMREYLLTSGFGTDVN